MTALEKQKSLARALDLAAHRVVGAAGVVVDGACPPSALSESLREYEAANLALKEYMESPEWRAM